MISRFTRRSFLLAACLATFTAVCVAQTSDQRLQEVATSETVQFTAALAQNAISAVDLALPPGLAAHGLGLHGPAGAYERFFNRIFRNLVEDDALRIF